MIVHVRSREQWHVKCKNILIDKEEAIWLGVNDNKQTIISTLYFTKS